MGIQKYPCIVIIPNTTQDMTYPPFGHHETLKTCTKKQCFGW